MPIIDPTPTPPLVAKANALKGRVRRQFSDLERLAREISAWIWEGKDYTPQQAFDALGTDASDLLKVADAYGALLVAYFGSGVVLPSNPPGKTLTRNPDGTVTVSG